MNSNASFAAGPAHRGQGGAHLGVGQRPLVHRPRVHLRQRGADRVPGGVVAAVALADGPLHDLPDAKPQPARGLVLLNPQRLKHRHQVRRVDGVHGLAPDARVRVALERAAPLRLGAAAGLPARAVHGDDLLGGFGERRRDAPPLGPGVGAGAGPAAVVVGSLARLGQRDQLGAAEAEVAPRAVDREALHPGLAAAAGTGLDEQVQAVAVAVAPEPLRGFDRAHERRGEAVHGALPAR